MWRTIGAAYGFVFGRPSAFLPAAWPWFALLIAIFVASSFNGPRSSPAVPLSPSQQVFIALALTLGVYVGGLAFFVSVSVAIHRAIILNEISWRAPLQFARRQWRFFGVGILITLAMIVPLLVLQWILSFFLFAMLKDAHFMSPEFMRGVIVFGAVEWALGLVVWGIGSNMMIALPSVAVDEPPLPISRALERSRGNGWRLYFGSLLCYAPFVALELATQFLAFWHSIQQPEDSALNVFVRYGELMGSVLGVSWLVYVIHIAVLVAYYSYAFRELTGAIVAPESSQQPQGLPAQ